MALLINFLILILGLVVLVKGADWLVDGASAIAKSLKVSDLAIGLTIVAFGTSAPELVVNVIGTIDGYDNIAFGNVIGSNNFNLFFILGVAGVITPLAVKSSTVWKEIPFSLLAVGVLAFLANGVFHGGAKILNWFDALILLAFFCGFLYYVYNQLKIDPESHPELQKKISTKWAALMILGGLTGLVLGGKLVVDNAIDIAKALDVSDKIIGLTIVAAGTSLPELATSVVAAIKKNSDIAVGNIVGSNIFNIFLILGVSSLISPLDYDVMFNRDLVILGIGTLFVFGAMFVGKRHTLDRWQSVLFLVAYIAYVVYMIKAEV